MPVAVLYARHYLGLVRFAIQFLDDVESAEEAVQDVFARLYQGTGQPVHYPYLRAAVLNQCRSVLRRRRLTRSLPRFHQVASDPADSRLLAASEYAAVRDAIGHLPLRQREVLVLRYYEELSPSETASALRISIGAVSTALSRAISAIAATLHQEDE